MMWLGTLYFDEDEQDWKIRIGGQMYETFTGIEFGIRIKNRYFEAFLEEEYNNEWIVTLEDDITFVLRLIQEYKVRISTRELVPAFDLPF